MIEIIGHKGSSEYRAAEQLKEAFVGLWPGIGQTPIEQDDIKIVVSVTISGYQVSDIDIIVCGVFERERKFVPRKLLHDLDGNRILLRPVAIQNFIVAIEVKDHDESGVKITSGDNVDVKYSKGHKQGWKSATDQNIKQLHSFNDYLSDRHMSAYIHRCLIMQGLGDINVDGAVASGFDGIDFFTSICAVSKVKSFSRGCVFSSGKNEDIRKVLKSRIFHLLVPTALDRKRMDMIIQGASEMNVLQEKLGKKMVRLRGHGGTGKTIMCIQLAWKNFQEKGLRTLVLTYNHALAADIRRLTSLLNIPSTIDEGGIAVNTVMSFMFTWFYQLGVIEKEQDLSFDNYASYCQEALEYIQSGAVTREEIENIVTKDIDRFGFDCFVIDEAQDWPQEEAELLKALCKPINLLLADGIDQLVRGTRTDWDKGLDKKIIDVVTLSECRRMKSNLSVFANSIAITGGLNWQVIPSTHAGGGKIYILNRPYLYYEDFHQNLLTEAKEKGNDVIDCLLCVPSQDVIPSSNDRVSALGQTLVENGTSIWDGVDPLARKDYPRSREQFRIVQYASCRGLEGWTVVLDRADLFYEECWDYKKHQGLTKDEEMAFEDLEEACQKYALQRMMIALTRAIDSLVITIESEGSDFHKLIKLVAKEYPDFIEIIE
jgi:hypothetical protein